jgi:hypothetical protein
MLSFPYLRWDVTGAQSTEVANHGFVSMLDHSAEGDMEPHATSRQVLRHIARIVLVLFLFSFVLARIIVFLIMFRMIPDLYVYIGGTHLHHLNYGIFMLAGVGAYMLFRFPTGRGAEVAAAVYGVGMALTFDEFGMWLHLGGSYWQRASWDAIIVISAMFALLAFAPSLNRFRSHNWAIAALVAVGVCIFFVMLFHTL